MDEGVCIQNLACPSAYRRPVRVILSSSLTSKYTIFAGVILREAENLAPQELTRQLLKQSIEDGLADEVISNDEYQHPPQKESSPPSPSSIRSFVKSFVSPLMGQKSSTNWANVQVNTHHLN